MGRPGFRRRTAHGSGFIADHVEVLYNIDIGVQQIAWSCDVRVERIPMLNDSPALVAALAELVKERS